METDRREITPDLIQAITQKIVEHFDPRRIVLFGSWARGDADPHSDIDLFVVMESDLPGPKRAAEISKIFGLRRWPMDLIVYTPGEVEQVRGVHGTLFSIIEDEGEVLYERETGDELPRLAGEGRAMSDAAHRIRRRVLDVLPDAE